MSYLQVIREQALDFCRNIVDGSNYLEGLDEDTFLVIDEDGTEGGVLVNVLFMLNTTEYPGWAHPPEGEEVVKRARAAIEGRVQMYATLGDREIEFTADTGVLHAAFHFLPTLNLDEFLDLVLRIWVHLGTSKVGRVYQDDVIQVRYDGHYLETVRQRNLNPTTMVKFDNLSREEAEELREHLAKIRKKRALEAKLEAAREEAARLKEELGELDDIEMSEDDQWERIESLTPEQRHEEALRQAKLAEDFRREQEIVGPLEAEVRGLRETWGQEESEERRRSIEESLKAHNEEAVRQGHRPSVEGIMPEGHGRTARHATQVNPELGEKHEIGKLSARGLPADYHGNVRVIKHTFKHRAYNPRQRVDDETLPDLRKKNPRMDDDW